MISTPLGRSLVLPCLLLGLASCSDQTTDPPNPPATVVQAPGLSALPEFTAGTAVTLAWSVPAPGKDEADRQYLAQHSVDADFETIAAESGWIEATETTFEELDHGERHHFRVRARDAQGTLSDWSDVLTSTTDNAGPVLAIAIPDTFRTSLLFNLELSAEDDLSGLADLELWYRVDDGELVDHGPVETGTLAFLAEGAGTHEFFLGAGDVAGNRVEPEGGPLASYEVPEPIIIIDRHGEEFDITNAVLRHGIHVIYWDHGIGRGTIRPVIDPVMIGPGHPAYPSENNLEDVCGLPYDGDNRAYRLSDLNDKEVANDTVNGVTVAVCY